MAFLENEGTIENINKIYTVINDKLISEINRLKNKYKNDPRIELLQTLSANIDNSKDKIIKKFLDPDVTFSYDTWKWKESLKNALHNDIKSTLNNDAISKKYTDLEKFGRKLLNIITGMLFPLAIIKYAATGNTFYSKVGKTTEALEESLSIVKKIK